MGGALKGGFAGDWPGLAQKHLFDDSALVPTVDLRAVFKGVLRDHVGVPIEILNTTVFPESAGIKPLGRLIGAPASAATNRLSAFNMPRTNAEAAPILRYRKRYGT